MRRRHVGGKEVLELDIQEKYFRTAASREVVSGDVRAKPTTGELDILVRAWCTALPILGSGTSWYFAAYGDTIKFFTQSG